LFNSLIGTLRGAFTESIDWNGVKDELVNIQFPYNFQLQSDRFFHITIHDLDDSFILSFSPLRVSRSHYLDYIRFRTLVDLSHNGELR